MRRLRPPFALLWQKRCQTDLGDRPQPANAAEMAVDLFWLLPAIPLTARLLFHTAACAHLENPSRRVGLSEGLIGDLKSRIESLERIYSCSSRFVVFVDR